MNANTCKLFVSLFLAAGLLAGSVVQAQNKPVNLTPEQLQAKTKLEKLYSCEQSLKGLNFAKVEKILKDFGIKDKTKNVDPQFIGGYVYTLNSPINVFGFDVTKVRTSDHVILPNEVELDFYVSNVTLEEVAKKLKLKQEGENAFSRVTKYGYLSAGGFFKAGEDIPASCGIAVDDSD
jgi:hypothetical protein